jgi:hypothetical protein
VQHGVDLEGGQRDGKTYTYTWGGGGGLPVQYGVDLEDALLHQQHLRHHNNHVKLLKFMITIDMNGDVCSEQTFRMRCCASSKSAMTIIVTFADLNLLSDHIIRPVREPLC